ncbi:hypothetical protein STA3757_06780 [Stanieria sp. NIES-3757]|nr:hypothetical protein STA3757_06780 [Stanieria sp. NIES-3757]
MGLDKPATVAIVDGNTGKVIVYRSIKQLLGENYRLLNRQRQQKQALSLFCHFPKTFVISKVYNPYQQNDSLVIY